MDRIESAQMGAVMLLFAVVLAFVVIAGSNSMAAHNPVLDRIFSEENSNECIATAHPESDCGLDFESGLLLAPIEDWVD